MQVRRLMAIGALVLLTLAGLTTAVATVPPAGQDVADAVVHAPRHGAQLVAGRADHLGSRSLPALPSVALPVVAWSIMLVLALLAGQERPVPAIRMARACTRSSRAPPTVRASR